MEARGDPNLALAAQGDELVAPRAMGRHAAARRFLVLAVAELGGGGLFLAGVNGDVVASAGVPIR
jgi:hypothetical protein